MRRAFLYLISTSLILSACSITRRVKDGEFLLVKNEIVDRSASLFDLNPDIDPAEFEAYIKQKPNRKVLVMRLHLRIYNMVNEEKMNKKKVKHDVKIDKKNEKRKKKAAKENKEPKLKSKNRLTWREWLRSIGEAPVIFDSLQMGKSARQIKLYMNNKGYFNSTVKDSVVLKNKKATVYYLVTPGQPYKIRNVNFEIKDEQVAYFAGFDSCLVKSGNNYDVDVLQEERTRIEKTLKNNGFYFFSKEFVYYKIDSSLNANQVDVTIGIKNPFVKLDESSDSLVEIPHQRFYIRNIYVITDYNPKSQPQARDTLLTNDIYILSSGKLKYKPKVITDAMYVYKGEVYQSSHADATYNRFSGLKAFKLVNIVFKPAGGDQLDCFVQLSPVKKQAFTFETTGTNTGGNKGVDIGFVYQNRNLFKGAEVFDFKIKTALEVQKLNNTDNTGNIPIGNESVIPFNTFEIGPEMSLTVPRAMLPDWKMFHFSQNTNPRTVFNTSYNFQQRPDFERQAFVLSYGYMWRESPKTKIAFYPVEMNYVLIDPSVDFQAALDAVNDVLYKVRYTDHVSLGSRLAVTMSNQFLVKQRDYYYMRWNIDAAGNGLRSYHNIVKMLGGKIPLTSEGKFAFFGIQYSQYIRSDIDWRYYFHFGKHNQLVLRAFGGIGKPFVNLRELPLERSFYAGGPNGIRAWKARTLGPGSFRNLDETDFDKLGDNQLEFNIEYRFNLFKMLNGALFIDAGNIWLRKPDPLRPGGEWRAKYFYKEFAVGTGLGARLDFDFFIIRLDMGIKMVDPSFGYQGRLVYRYMFDRQWKVDYKTYYGQKYTFLNFNFGIGYPF